MTKSKPDEWVNVSDHAVTLASGRPLAPGEGDTFVIDTDHDRQLRDEGLLIRADHGDEKEADR